MTIKVETTDDWQSIAAIGGPVVDPMILRCGELFLRGAGNAYNPADAWDLLDKNIHALGTFFDRLILDDKIPVFDYSFTFDVHENFAGRTLAAVNSNEEVLVDVNVSEDAYTNVKNAALADLKKLFAGGAAGIDAAQASQILQELESVLGELSSSGYAWYPNLGDMVFATQNEQRLAAYILGGLIFGGYAQLAGTDHLMQPKRSRLFVALTLRQSASRSAEDYLFTQLGELTGRATAEVPYTPTFFPLLLSESNSPAQLLQNALNYRRSPEVADYRAWLRETLGDFNRNGRIAIERFHEVERIAAAIERRRTGMLFPTLEVKTTLADVLALRLPEVSLDLTEPAKNTWGWFVSQLPGKRHRKLLTRALIADQEYVNLGQRVMTVWYGPGVAA